MDLHGSCSKIVRRAIQPAEEVWIQLQLMWVASFLEKTKPNSQNWATSASREFQACPLHRLPESVRKRCWALPGLLSFQSRKISQHLNNQHNFKQKKHRQRAPASIATETSSVKAEFTISNNELFLNKHLGEGIRQRQPCYALAIGKFTAHQMWSQRKHNNVI